MDGVINVVVVGFMAILCYVVYRLCEYAVANDGFNTLRKRRYKVVMSRGLHADLYLYGPGYWQSSKRVAVDHVEDPANNTVVVKITGVFDKEDFLKLI